MKKFLITLSIVLCMTMMVGAFCYATEEGTEPIVDEGTQEIDSIEEYEDVSDESGVSQNELSVYYGQYIDQLFEMYDSYERTAVVKAQVMKVGDVEQTYNVDYYSVYEIKYQKVTLKILEGEYKDEVYEDVQYTLTADALNNVKIAKVNVGDVIYITMEADETTGEVVPKIASADTQVNRYGWVIALTVIAIAVFILCAGKYGIKMILPAILVVDLILVILVPSMITGISGLLLASISAVVLIVVNAISKNGLNKKAIVTSISAIIVVLIAVGLTYGINFVTRMTGSTTEVDTLAETILKRNIDFTDIYMVTVIFVVSILASNVAANITNKMAEKAVEDNTIKNVIKYSREIVADNIGVIVVLCMALLIPRFLILVGQKYQFFEIINSERFLSEFVRMLVFIISISITSPITAFLGSKMKVKQELLKIDQSTTSEEK